MCSECVGLHAHVAALVTATEYAVLHHKYGKLRALLNHPELAALAREAAAKDAVVEAARKAMDVTTKLLDEVNPFGEPLWGASPEYHALMDAFRALDAAREGKP